MIFNPSAAWLADVRPHGVFRQGKDFFFEVCRPRRKYVRIFRAVSHLFRAGGDSGAGVSMDHRSETLLKKRKTKSGKRKSARAAAILISA